MTHVLQYVVKMKFAPGAKDPSRLFLSMGKVLDGFRRMDIMLARTVGQEVSFEQVQTDFEAGSFISKIKESFEYESASLSDDPPAETSDYIGSSRRNLLTALRDNPKIEELEPIMKIAAAIEEAAGRRGLKKLLAYRPMQPIEIADSLAGVADSTRSLQQGEQISYQAPGEDEVQVPTEASVATHKIEEALIHKRLSVTRDIILKIRRPDYLGEAMWEFRHGKNPIPAKILDAEWLERFRTKEERTGPGDSLEASVVITEEYDKHGNLIRERYEVAKVKAVIPGDVDET